MQTFSLSRQITRGAALASRLCGAEHGEAAQRRDAVHRWRGTRRQGLSAADAAAALGVSRATLYRWAAGAEPDRAVPGACGAPNGRPPCPLACPVFLQRKLLVAGFSGNSSGSPVLVSSTRNVRTAMSMRSQRRVRTSSRRMPV